jgi:aspartate aminotransferase
MPSRRSTYPLGPPVPDAVGSMARSGIREIMDEALVHPGTLRLELGEPDFPTPPSIVEAAARAMRDGHTRYTATVGIPSLREAIADKVASRNGFPTDASRVLVSSGAVQGLFAALVSVIDPGDEILVPTPGWPNYLMMTRMLRARGVGYALDASNGFQPDIALLEELVTERTRAIVLNSPSNPLGSVMSAENTRAMVDFARRHDLWVISDECYDELVYEGEHVSPAQFDLDGRVVSVFSFSKTYAMTGWRIGYVVLPERLTRVVSNAHEASISCVAEATQFGALEAISGSQADVVGMRDTYLSRRDRALVECQSVGVRAFKPAGAFYLWLDVSESGQGSRDVALDLVRNHGLAVAPGSAFGETGAESLRLSIAASEETIVEGIRRIGAYLNDRQ